jgi:hypothetical protein
MIKLFGPVRTVHITTVKLSADDGKLKEELVQSPRTIEYDISGHAIEEVLHKHDGSIHSKSVFTYDAEGVLLEQIRLDLGGSLMSRTTYVRDPEQCKVEKSVYDNNGVLLEKSVQTTDETPDYKVTASYNAEGQLILKGVHFSDDQGRLIRLIIIKSAPNEPTMLSLHKGIDENKIVEGRGKNIALTVSHNELFAGEIKYIYNEEKNSEEEFIYKDDGSLVRRKITVFDEARSPVEVFDYHADGSLVGKETYTREFDSQKNWIKQTKSKLNLEIHTLETVEIARRAITYY